ncbi:hypothetical protein [Providencia hangzhouensis]|uniref:hypothetical protein n=1 Tax=Providencia hangzhouensis TaxID=3031799 RepID=UPI00397A3BA5
MSVGQVVYTNLYNLGKGVIVNIHGEQKPQSINNMYNVMVTGGNAEFDIVFFNLGIKLIVCRKVFCTAYNGKLKMKWLNKKPLNH